MVPAEGIGILSLIDSAQVVDSIKREKRQKQRICLSELQGGYTEGGSLRPKPLIKRKRQRKHVVDRLNPQPV